MASRAADFARRLAILVICEATPFAAAQDTGSPYELCVPWEGDVQGTDCPIARDLQSDDCEQTFVDPLARGAYANDECCYSAISRCAEKRGCR